MKFYLTKYSNENWMVFDKIIKYFISNFFNFVRFKLLHKPIKNVSFNSKISGVNVRNIVFKIDKSWEITDAKTLSLYLITNL